MPNYVYDTSSLINIKQYYPRVAFLSLWNKIGSLAETGRLAAPIQVLRELESKNDELLAWAMKHRRMFQKNSAVEVKFAAMLAGKYSAMTTTDSATERADPYVIALAHYRTYETLTGEWAVVTEEADKAGRMPQISKSYELRHCRLVDVILEEKWSFV